MQSKSEAFLGLPAFCMYGMFSSGIDVGFVCGELSTGQHVGINLRKIGIRSALA